MSKLNYTNLIKCTKVNTPISHRFPPQNGVYKMLLFKIESVSAVFLKIVSEKNRLVAIFEESL